MTGEDRGDAIVVTWTPPERPMDRVVFEPQYGGGYERVTETRDEEGWRPTGAEYVESVSVENGGQA